MGICRCRPNVWEIKMSYYTCALYSKNLVVCRRITVVIVIVPLRFQKIVWASCPHISSSTCCMFWSTAWWALRLHWWPLVECSNASMYLVLISTNIFVPVSLLYSVGNKIYYYYWCDIVHFYHCVCTCICMVGQHNDQIPIVAEDHWKEKH